MNVILFHQMARHIGRDQSYGYPILCQFPLREPGALQKWPSLVSDYRDALARFHGGPDHAQRGAVTGRGQRPCIAMGQHCCAILQQRRSMLPLGAVDTDVLGRDLMHFGK